MVLELLTVAALLLWASSGNGGGSLFPGGSAMGNPSAFINALRARKGWLYSLGAGLPGEKPSPPYIDCGELIRQSLSEAGITGVPRNITGQVNAAPFTLNVQGWTRDALINALRPGDCVAFDWPGGFEGRPYDHGVAWTGDSIVHASGSKGKVVEGPMLNSGWKTVYSWWR